MPPLLFFLRVVGVLNIFNALCLLSLLETPTLPQSLYLLPSAFQPGAVDQGEKKYQHTIALKLRKLIFPSLSGHHELLTLLEKYKLDL